MLLLSFWHGEEIDEELMIRVTVAALLSGAVFDSKGPQRLHGVRSIGRNENADARKDIEECSGDSRNRSVVARMGMQRNVIGLLIDTS